MVQTTSKYKKAKWDKIQKILFPPTEFRIDSDGDKYAVLKSIDANLNAALQDLRDDKNDEAVQATIEYCMVISSRVREIMELQYEFEPDTKFIIVDFDEENMQNV